jgi:hypothetical protein
MNWPVFFTVLGILAGASLVAAAMVFAREWLKRHVSTDASFAIVLGVMFLAAAITAGVLAP